jgi:hypothetical protein
MRFIFQQNKSNFTCNPGDTLALVLIYASSFVLYVDVALSLLSELRLCYGTRPVIQNWTYCLFCKIYKTYIDADMNYGKYHCNVENVQLQIFFLT